MPPNPFRGGVFATKPALARKLIERAVHAQVPAGWVTADEVYGADPALRAAIRSHGLGYVLAVSTNRRVPTAAGPIRVDHIPGLLPRRARQQHSAGAGSRDQRLYSWAWIALSPEDDADPGQHYLLIRRNDRTRELAYLRCYSPRPVTLRALVGVAGQRWRIEESFQAAKDLTGLDQHQVRRWTSWHRWTTLATLAHAFLAVAARNCTDPRIHSILGRPKPSSCGEPPTESSFCPRPISLSSRNDGQWVAPPD